MEEPHRIVFFGSGDFAFLILKNLIEKGVRIELVVTAPDKPGGRGRKPRPTPVKVLASESGMRVITPESPNRSAGFEAIKAIKPDFFVLTDYGKIISKRLLDVPSKAPLNIHPSLLPAYRGAAPMERAMMACERRTGVTVMVMDTGIDTGPILLQEATRIGETETRGELAVRLAEIGTRLILRAINEFDKLTPKPQPSRGVSYAPKITKDELWIDWNSSAMSIACKINALSPRPGARTYFDGNYVKPLRARFVEGDWGTPGRVHIIDKKRLVVAARGGGVEILEIMPSGRRVMRADEYLRGHSPLEASSNQ